MGRIVTSLDISGPEKNSKSFRIDALVDTGAAYLTLPLEWKSRLPTVEVIRELEVELATQDRITAEVAGPVKIQIEGFPAIFSEVLFVPMQPRDGIFEPLLGYIPLEQSQAGVDLLGHRLVNLGKADLK